MAKKLVEAITSMEDDFAQWYTDVVKKAELCGYTSVKGCMAIKPAGYAIWENIQHELDRRFKETGVQNVYMPMFIPESLLQKEKDHVEGFAPEVAWVTHGGLNELQERLCVRPTSETLFCDFYQKDIQSHRDLPKVYNQWCSVVRWEKTTRPFLRSREFQWQEYLTIDQKHNQCRNIGCKIDCLRCSRCIIQCHMAESCKKKHQERACSRSINSVINTDYHCDQNAFKDQHSIDCICSIFVIPLQCFASENIK